LCRKYSSISNIVFPPFHIPENCFIFTGKLRRPTVGFIFTGKPRARVFSHPLICFYPKADSMLNAFLWGFLATSSLILGGVMASRLALSKRGLGIIMAFGAGALISAVSY
jgi:hypothetical protein